MQPEASYFVRVRGESMTGLGILDGDYCLADRSEEISNGIDCIPMEDMTKKKSICTSRSFPTMVTDTGVQTNFIDYDAERHEKLRRLDEALDKLNREYGSESVVLGSQQYVRQQDMAVGKKVEASVFKDSIKHDFRSPCYTTRWSDVPEATYPPTLSPFPPYSFPLLTPSLLTPSPPFQPGLDFLEILALSQKKLAPSQKKLAPC